MIDSDRFTADRWPGRPSSAPKIIIGLGSVMDYDDVSWAADDPVTILCDHLGIPEPEIVVQEDKSLAADEFAISIGGATRFLGSTTTSWSEWWIAHPAAGEYGRCDTDGRATEHLIARALEEVLWSDPSVLWNRVATAQFRAQWSQELELDPTRPELLHSILCGLVARRISLSDADRVRDALAGVGADKQVYRIVEQLSSELIPATIELRLGERVQELIPDQAACQTMIRDAKERLFLRFGVGFPTVSIASALDLSEDSFQVVINGLPRASGRIPEDRACMLLDEPPNEEDAEADLFVHPLTKARLYWLPTGEGYRANEVFSPAELLAANVEACLAEAANEFADLAWIQRLLDQTEATNNALISWLRGQHNDELVAAVGRALVAEGVSLRLLNSVLERMLELDDYVENSSFIGSDSHEERSPAAVLEYARAALRPQLLADHWRTGAPVDAIILKKPVESALKAAVSRNSDAWAVARGAAARLVLQSLKRRPADAAALPIITSSELRAHVRQLIAAQYPDVRVHARSELRDPTAINPCFVVRE